MAAGWCGLLRGLALATPPWLTSTKINSERLTSSTVEMLTSSPGDRVAPCVWYAVSRCVACLLRSERAQPRSSLLIDRCEA